jgi:NAD(P)-dependent dehydrogenase (short-subunit alcohol dehydrogenase family)
VLTGRVVFLSGVGPGLGRDTALVCARDGAQLVLAARDVDRLKLIASEVRELGAEVETVPTDITDSASCVAAVSRAVTRFGRVDALVNLAFRESSWRSLVDAADDLHDWRPAFDVNFFGTMTMTRAVVDQMIPQGNGSIVMVNSIASEGLMARIADYSASKAALAAATRTLALELGPHGIRVNGIHPGTMWGPYNQGRFEQRASLEGTTIEHERAEAAAATPLRYLPKSVEVAEVIAFFVSGRARAVTGQQLHVNVGQLLH